MQHLGHDGRHEGRADARLVDERAQSRQVHALLFRRNADAPAVHKRREDLEDGGVEDVRGKLQHACLRPKRLPVVAARGAHGPVLQHHTLRLARAAGCENDVRDVLSSGRVLLILLILLLLFLLQHLFCLLRHLNQHVRHPFRLLHAQGAADEDPGAKLLNNRLPSIPRVLRVERHEGGASPQHCQDGNNVPRRALKAQRHQITPANTELPKPARQPSRLAVELPVREADAARADSFSVRGRGRRSGNLAVQRSARLQRRRARVPGTGERLVVLAKQPHRCHRRLRRQAGQLVDDGGQVVAQGLGVRARERLRVEGGAQRDVVGVQQALEHERVDVVALVRRHEVVDDLDAEPVRVAVVGLHDEQVLEVAGVARHGRDVLHAVVLVRDQRVGLALDGIQQLRDRVVAAGGGVDADGQRGKRRAQHLVDAWHRRVAARHGGAEDDVLRLGPVRQHQRPRRAQHRRCRDVCVCAASGGHVESEDVVANLVPLCRACKSSAWEINSRGALELVLEESRRVFGVGRLDVFDVAAERAGRLDVRLVARVRLLQHGKDLRQAPAIVDGVVCHPDKVRCPLGIRRHGVARQRRAVLHRRRLLHLGNEGRHVSPSILSSLLL
ncbi:hypothetical protein B0J12DRAFT_673125 [Macrophomina phaseolina]|uniref:Uncharacterized protein n=1 Tax=Macrophomina phaseolina TaxID=35725 RepID=A0ABQ8G2I7_9PEZI|nr:hypothetical protein B0J12DRAFT_673125 [Macrophomina phaseolina]